MPPSFHTTAGRSSAHAMQSVGHAGEATSGKLNNRISLGNFELPFA